MLQDARNPGGVVELGAHHQTSLADLEQAGVLALQFPQAGGELIAAVHHVLEEAWALHDVDRGEGSSATDRVAAVSAAVAALWPLVVEFATSAEGGEREAAGDALGHTDDVGFDAVVLDGEHLARSAETALHFVGDEHDPVLAATFDEAVDESRRGGDVATLAHHRLEDDSGGLVGRGHRLQ